MRAHVAKQPSILNAVAQLLPDQILIIQERVKERKGELVSALFGADVDLVTQMGTFRTKAVVFVLKTRAEKVDEGEQEAKQYSCWGAKVDTPAPTTSSALFAGLPLTTSSPPPHAPGFPTTAMDRDGSKSQVLGGPGFFREKEGFFGVMQEYMSISTSDAYKDKSFEEIRMADYKAGRTKDGDVKPAFSFAEKKMDSTKAAGLFGQQLSTAPGAAPSSNTPCFFSQSTSTLTSGLSSQTKSTLTPDPVGQSTPTPTPSLFAKATPPTSAFTFGLKSTPVSDGLGNKSGTPFTSGGLFSGPSVAELAKQLSPNYLLCLDCAEKVKLPATDDATEEDSLARSHGENLEAFGERFIAHKEDTKRKEKAERKQEMKEKDFDPAHETEEVWSARYERLERYRIADAQKPPKVPGTIYTVDTDGVVRARSNPLPADFNNSSAGVAPVVSTNPSTALARVAPDASAASAFHMFSTPGSSSAPDVPNLGDGSKDGDAGDGDGKKDAGKEQKFVEEQAKKD